MHSAHFDCSHPCDKTSLCCRYGWKQQRETTSVRQCTFEAWAAASGGGRASMLWSRRRLPAMGRDAHYRLAPGGADGTADYRAMTRCRAQRRRSRRVTRGCLGAGARGPGRAAGAAARRLRYRDSSRTLHAEDPFGRGSEVRTASPPDGEPAFSSRHAGGEGAVLRQAGVDAMACHSCRGADVTAGARRDRGECRHGCKPPFMGPRDGRRQGHTGSGGDEARQPSSPAGRSLRGYLP